MDDFKPCTSFLYGGVWIIGETEAHYIGTFDGNEVRLPKGANADLDKAYNMPHEQREQIPAGYEPPF